MSGQRAPSSSPMPPPLQELQSFRFWLPYRSNVGSWRQQQRRPPSPRPVPSSPQPRQPPTPPPTPAEPPHSRGDAVVEDIPVQGESSDESDTIPVQSSDSPQRRGRPSVADMELTLSGAPSAGHGQSSGGDGTRPNNDTKIAISGFPRSRLFDGARAPYRQEVEDGLKSLAQRGAPPAPPRPENGQGYRVITLAGHNVGASMVVGSGGARDDVHAAPPGDADPERPGGSAAAKPPPAVAANMNSNVQSVNNSSLEGSTCSAGNPGVHVDVKNGREEPKPTPRKDEKPKRRPPLVVPSTTTTRDKGAAPSSAPPAPARPRRCLRALMMMENGSDAEAAARKPRPGPCRFQCVADHKPPAPATSSGGGAGAGGTNAGSGGKESSANQAN